MATKQEEEGFDLYKLFEAIAEVNGKGKLEGLFVTFAQPGDEPGKLDIQGLMFGGAHELQEMLADGTRRLQDQIANARPENATLQ